MYEHVARDLREQSYYLPQDYTYRLVLEAADAIDQLEALCKRQEAKLVELTEELASKPRWVPVTERLPEKFENVIVANKRGKHFDIDKGWWNGSFFDRCAKGGYHNVTHWMPLPQAPKEE